MSNIGPAGAISGAQTYSPAFRFDTVSTTDPELTSTCCPGAEAAKSPASPAIATWVHLMAEASTSGRSKSLREITYLPSWASWAFWHDELEVYPVGAGQHAR